MIDRVEHRYRRPPLFEEVDAKKEHSLYATEPIERNWPCQGVVLLLSRRRGPRDSQGHGSSLQLHFPCDFSGVLEPIQDVYDFCRTYRFGLFGFLPG
jgi:hypothetical protein